MQVSKTYTGEVTLEEKRIDRPRSYGGNTVTTISVYPSKVDTLNRIIADFLQGCGVDADYKTGPDSEWPFLWIYGVPFLFGMTGTSDYPNFYNPYNSRSITTTNPAGAAINLFSGAKYSFGLVFAGNPKNGFYLRFKPYNTTSVSSSLVLRFVKGQNIINGASSVLWSTYNGPDTLGATYLTTGFEAVDFDGNTPIEKSYTGTTRMYYTPLLQTLSENMEYNEGALPLVPLMIGPYRANGIYLRPRNYGLPVANSFTVEVQNEITVGGRSFLITNSDSPSISMANMGLIETT